MSYRSRLTTRAGACICRQAGRLAALRPSPAPAPAFREGVNVLPTRTEVIEEVQLLPVNDHLVPAQFNELVLGQEAEESLLMPDE
jgi:hypothetical protein